MLLDHSARSRRLCVIGLLLITGSVGVTRASLAASTETVLWSFGEGPDGSLPFGTPVMDKSGALYGTTYGSYSSAQYGTVFKLVPATSAGGTSSLTTLYTFTGGADGGYPSAGLIMDTHGALYGTASFGGSGCGVVFKLSPPTNGSTVWTEKVLLAFPGQEGVAPAGCNPVAKLIFDSTGNLYGTTSSGGTSDYGVVFKLTAPSAGQRKYVESVLYSFSGIGSDGLSTQGLLLDQAGNLYGTTSGQNDTGLGEVFALSPPSGAQTSWQESVLWTFGGAPDGEYPGSGVVMDSSGALYGVTTTGGGAGSYYASSGNGAVYKLSPPAAGGTQWSESIVWDFPNSQTDGTTPYGDLLMTSRGLIYGTTYAGGILDPENGYYSTGCGVVYELKPPVSGAAAWREATLYSFGTVTNCYDGDASEGGLVENRAGTLFGTTTRGGSAYGQNGTVFQVTQ
jgi:uncharacterized repeat protein (TIGR03803 family)